MYNDYSNFLCRMGHLFWSSISNDVIMMSNLDGSLPKPILNQGLYNPRIFLCIAYQLLSYNCLIHPYTHTGGLSVDWINNKIYFVNDHYGRGNDYIGVLDFTNNQFMELITTSVGNLEDVVVDPTTRYFY